jgi:hypothetical protein
MSAAGSAGNSATWSGMTAMAVVISNLSLLPGIALIGTKRAPIGTPVVKVSAARSRPRRIGFRRS